MSGWHPDLPEDDDMTGRAALYARLPLQLALIAWARAAARD